MLDSRLMPWIYWYNEVFGIKIIEVYGYIFDMIKKKSMWWPSCYSRSYPMIGHMWVEHIASMSWRKGLCDHSWFSSRHHLLKREEKIQGWSTSSGDRHQAWVVQVQEKYLEDIICLMLATLLEIMVKWSCAYKRLSHSGVWGSNMWDFTKRSAINKGGSLEEIKVGII